MANHDGSVLIEIDGDESKFKGKLDGLGGIASSAMKGVATAVAAATAAIGAAGAAAVKFGSEFEQTMANTSTMFGDVAVDTKGLNDQILALSSSTGMAADDIGKSLYNALSAGIPVTEDMGAAMGYMESSVKLAKAGFTDVDTAVTATAKVLNAYKMDVSEVDKVHTVLMQTQNKGITTVGELGASLAQVTPTAAAMSVSFEQVGAALATMTAQGTPTAQATTQLNALLAELGKSGTQAQKGLEAALAGTEHAGKSFQDLMKEGVPLNTVLDLMGGQAQKSGKSLLDMFGSIEAGKAALAMSGQNAQQFASNLEAMGTEADVVGSAYEKATDTLQNKLSILQESFKNLGIAAYEGMSAPLKDVAGTAIDMVSSITEAFSEGGLEAAVEAVGGVFADLVTEAANAAPAMIEAGVSLIGALLDGVQENAGKIAEGASEMAAAFTRGVIELLPEIIQTGVSLLTALIQGLADTLPELIPQAVDAVLTLVDGLLDNLDDLVDAGIELIFALAEGLIEALPRLVEKAPEIVSKLMSAIISNAPKLLEASGQLIVKLLEGIKNGLPKLGQAAGEIVSTVVLGVGKLWSDLRETGKNVVTGVWEGIKGMGSWMLEQVTGFFGGIVDGVKNFLGIHSPSRVFAEMGGFAMEGFALGMKDEKGKTVQTAEELSKAILEAASSWVKERKHYNDMAARDEVAFWEELKAIGGLGAAELAEVDKNLYTAKAKASKEAFEYSKKWIDDEKFYNRLSAQEEVEAWERVVKRKNLAAAEQAEAEKKLYTARNVLMKEQAQAEEALYKQSAKAQADYEKAVASKAAGLQNFAGLFDQVERKSAVTGRELLNNLRGQVAAFEGWQADLQKLADRGVTGALLDELREMGPKAAGEIKALTQLSEKQLEEYGELFSAKGRLASEQAAAEIPPVELPVEAQPLTEESKATLTGAAGEAVSLVCQTVENRKEDVRHTGAQTMEGLVQGLREQGLVAVEVAGQIADAIVERMRLTLDIHSPSRRMARLVGEPAAQGLYAGFRDEIVGLGRMMQAAVAAETGKISLRAAVESEGRAGERSSWKDDLPQARRPQETGTQKVEIGFGASMNELARALKPYLDTENRRAGGSLVKGGGR